MKSLIPILLLAVSGGLFYLHVDPSYKEVKALIVEKGQYEEAVVKSKELATVRDELLTKYNSLPKDDLAKLERLIPTSINTVKLVADISGIAGQYGIAIKGINVKELSSDSGQQVGSTEGAKNYQTTVISFRFSATYTNLVKFLKDIEKSLQLIDIKSVAFTVNDLSSLNDYEITIQTYWLK